MLVLAILLSLVLITMIDNHVSGDRIVDDNVVIETVLHYDGLEKELEKEYVPISDEEAEKILKENELLNGDLNEEENKTSDTNTNTASNSNSNTNVNTNTNTNSNKIKLTDKTYSIININTASLDDLTILPGIGTATAEKIITYRNEHGLFNKIEDIKNVSGIGDAKFKKIKKYIEV